MKRPYENIRTAILIALGASTFNSCHLNHTVLPLEPTKFLASTGVDTSERISRIPFEHSWRDPSININDYKYIVVRPVTTRYLNPHEEEMSAEQKAAFKKQADALAKHFTRQLNVAFSDPICIFYKTNSTSRPGTFVLEVALVDVHFPDDDPTHTPLCAFEAKVTDAKTGKVVSTVADRRGPDIHISGDGTHLTDLEEICSIWARQLMESSNKEIFETVRRKLITVEDDPGHQH